MTGHYDAYWGQQTGLTGWWGQPANLLKPLIGLFHLNQGQGGQPMPPHGPSPYPTPPLIAPPSQ